MEASALLCLKGTSFNKISHRVLGATAMHDLLSRVVRITDQRPRDVLEKLASLELPHRLTSLHWNKK